MPFEDLCGTNVVLDITLPWLATSLEADGVSVGVGVGVGVMWVWG